MSTLALNIICGPGRARILERCLSTFNAKNLFDEIVIVNTSLDESVNEVARKFTDKVFFFQWESEKHPFGDFGGARNFAASKTESDKIWWLDTDDACLDQYKDKLVRAINLIKDDKYMNIKIWNMPYAVVLDTNGNPLSWFMRERVFDRRAIHWKRSVHEIMFPDITMAGKMTGLLKYLPDIKIKHNHMSNYQADQRDETFNRLEPIRQNAREKMGYAVAYATLCARNRILDWYRDWETDRKSTRLNSSHRL